MDGVNFLGTTDAVPLNFKVDSQQSGRIESAQNTANTFFGYQSGASNTGINNSGFGYQALASNTTGSNNVATGFIALANNTTGDANTAYGLEALWNNVTGSNNIAMGVGALANSTGNSNIGLGTQAGVFLTAGDANIYIGNTGNPSNPETGVIRIGTSGTHTATFVAGINGVNASAGVPVFILPSGQLGTGSLVQASAPSVGHGTAELKRAIARYETQNRKLKEELAEQGRKTEEQAATIAQLKSTMAEQLKLLTARLQEQDAKIQKVNAKVELNKPQTMQTAASED